jgi:hypothetical protein
VWNWSSRRNGKKRERLECEKEEVQGPHVTWGQNRFPCILQLPGCAWAPPTARQPQSSLASSAIELTWCGGVHFRKAFIHWDRDVHLQPLVATALVLSKRISSVRNAASTVVLFSGSATARTDSLSFSLRSRDQLRRYHFVILLFLGLLSNRIGANFTKFDLLFSNQTYTKVRFAANWTIFVEYSQFDKLLWPISRGKFKALEIFK